MTKDDLKILWAAAGILADEGFTGRYDEQQTDTLWDAGNCVYSAVAIIEMVDKQLGIKANGV